MSAFAGPGRPCPHVGCKAVFVKARNLEDHLEKAHHWKDGVAPKAAQLRPAKSEEAPVAHVYLCVECDPPTEWPSFAARAAHRRADHPSDDAPETFVASVRVCAAEGCTRPARDRQPGSRGPLPTYCSDRCAVKTQLAQTVADARARLERLEAALEALQ